ncbi:MAG: hypothetical protein HY868_00135 [Chloroflexi bacterium]|nr:hypothetical protein [Chloroflexota bacterium]
METYRVETIVAPNRVLTIRGIPFRAGEKIEVIILSRSTKHTDGERYPLRGKPLRFHKPFDSVAEQDWDALR